MNSTCNDHDYDTSVEQDAFEALSLDKLFECSCCTPLPTTPAAPGLEGNFGVEGNFGDRMNHFEKRRPLPTTPAAPEPEANRAKLHQKIAMLEKEKHPAKKTEIGLTHAQDDDHMDGVQINRRHHSEKQASATCSSPHSESWNNVFGARGLMHGSLGNVFHRNESERSQAETSAHQIHGQTKV